MAQATARNSPRASAPRHLALLAVVDGLDRVVQRGVPVDGGGRSWYL